MNIIKQNTLTVLLISALFALTGCGTNFKVSQYPAFYQPTIRDVAILPLRNNTAREGLGKAISNHLSAALAANGTYKITGPLQLEQMLKDKAMPSLPADDYTQTAEELGKLNKFQAFIAGEVKSESISNEVGIVDRYDYYAPYYFDFFYPYYFYYPYYYRYGTEIYISADASLISVPDGTVLYSTPVNATADVSGITTSFRKYAVQVAINNLCDKLVRKLAVVAVKITVYADKDLRTASSFQDGKWHYTKTFSPNDNKMYVVLCLPLAAAQNQFRLVITAKNNTENLIAEKYFIWQRDKYCQSFEFSPKQIASSNGEGQYSAKFYSRGKVIMAGNFQIKKP